MTQATRQPGVSWARGPSDKTTISEKARPASRPHTGRARWSRWAGWDCWPRGAVAKRTRASGNRSMSGSSAPGLRLIGLIGLACLAWLLVAGLGLVGCSTKGTEPLPGPGDADAASQEVDAAVDAFGPDTEPRSITIDPDWSEQGWDETISVYGTGTRFDGRTQVAFPGADGVEVLSVDVRSPTLLRAQVRVTSMAAQWTYQLAVTDGEGPLYASFEVRPDPNPPTTVLVPHAVIHGQTEDLDVMGQQTHFDSQQTTVKVLGSGSGVTVRLRSVSSPTEALVQVAVDAQTPPGLYQLAMVTGAELVLAPLNVIRGPDEVLFQLDPSGMVQGTEARLDLSGDDLQLDSTSRLEVTSDSGGGVDLGVEVEWFQVTEPSRAQVRLRVAQDAQVGPIRLLLITDSNGRQASGWLTIQPGQPVLSLAPSHVKQGWRSVSIEAMARFARFATPASVVPSSGCGVTVQSAEVVDATHMRFQVDVPVDEPTQDCSLVFATEAGPLGRPLHIDPGILDISLPGETDASVQAGQDTVFRLHLDAGQVVRVRATEAPRTLLDPVLTLVGPDGNVDEPLARNDDENEALYGSLVLYRAQAAGDYYVIVADRLGLHSAPFHLSVALWTPQGEEEDDAQTGASPGQPVTARVLRGEVGPAGSQDATDFFDVTSIVAGLPVGRAAISIVSWDVSPYQGSGTHSELSLFDGAGRRLASTGAVQTADPILYLDTATARYVTVHNLADSSGVYWLAVRPWVVINELSHDESDGWQAGFVELQGEPDADLSSCELVARGWDGHDATDLFHISLTGLTLDHTGYLVLCHDGLVSGCSSQTIWPDLAVVDPIDAYATIAISLRCLGVLADSLCWRGSALPECEGDPAPTWSSGVVGRGFGLDRDDNATDFMEQAEASPWARNLTEVR